MRILYALEFEANTKDSFVLLQQDLIPYCPKATFTRSINLHLTLCFLGEVKGHSLSTLKEILFALEFKPLHVKFDHLEISRKRKEKILWLGIEKNQQLEEMQSHLSKNLQENNLLLNEDGFHPHITLASGAKGRHLPEIEPFEVTSTKVSLMHSHQKQNILTYIPIFTKQL